MGSQRRQPGVPCPSCGSPLRVPWWGVLPSRGVYTLTCPGCGTRFVVSIRTIVIATFGLLLGILLGLPLFFMAIEAFHPDFVEIGVVVGVLAATSPGLALGALAGRLALRLSPVGAAPGGIGDQQAL